MAEKTYDHQIYHIAHPLVRKLIMQAIEVRKFRAIFPALFDHLSSVRVYVSKQLIEELKGPLQQYFEFEDEDEEKLYDQLDIILFERRLVDHALGYIQTGEVLLHDEFLVRNILTKQELEAIFSRLRGDFWNNTIVDYSPLIAEKPLTKEYTETLKKVLTVNDWHLPNLIPAWNIEDLFVDYVTVFLKYEKYKKSETDYGQNPENSDEVKRYPTFAETRECLAHIFNYDQPLLKAKGAFIDFHTAENGARSSNYFGLNMNLDDSPKNFPHLLSGFITMYASRRIDYYRGGQENALKEGHELQKMFEVSNTIVRMLDKLTNRKTALDRADSLISGLLALLYVDGVFKNSSKNELEDLELVNVIKICKFTGVFDRTDPIVIEQLREQTIASFELYSIDELVQKIIALFENNSEVKAELKIESGKKPTHIVFSIGHEKLSYELNIKGLKTKIKRMLGHFFLKEEEEVLTGKSQNSLGLSPIFTPLFQVVK